MEEVVTNWVSEQILQLTLQNDAQSFMIRASGGSALKRDEAESWKVPFSFMVLQIIGEVEDLACKLKEEVEWRQDNMESYCHTWIWMLF